MVGILDKHYGRTVSFTLSVSKVSAGPNADLSVDINYDESGFEAGSGRSLEGFAILFELAASTIHEVLGLAVSVAFAIFQGILSSSDNEYSAMLGWSKYNIAQAGGYFYVKLKVEDTSNVSVGDTFTYVYRCRASTIVYNLVPLSSPGIIAPQASEEY